MTAWFCVFPSVVPRSGAPDGALAAPRTAASLRDHTVEVPARAFRPVRPRPSPRGGPLRRVRSSGFAGNGPSGGGRHQRVRESPDDSEHPAVRPELDRLRQAGRQDVPIATFFAQNRQDVSWDQIAQTVKDATVSAEDPRFYTEGAVDISGTVRGAVSTVARRQRAGRLLDHAAVREERRGREVRGAHQPKKVQACYADAAGVTLQRKVQEMRYAVAWRRTTARRTSSPATSTSSASAARCTACRPPRSTTSTPPPRSSTWRRRRRSRPS